MNRCHACGELVEPQLLVCPDCRAPLAMMAPPSDRARYVVALVLVLTIVAIATGLGVHALVS